MTVLITLSDCGVLSTLFSCETTPLPLAVFSLTTQQLFTFFYDKVCAAIQFSRPNMFTGPLATHFNDFQLRTVDEIHRVIMHSQNKSYMLDPLPYSLLATVLEDILPLLHIICNTSLRDGVLPNCEKLAYIIPFLKKSGLDADLSI